MADVRLKEAGWEKLHVDVRRSKNKVLAISLAPIHRGATGLGFDFDSNFVEKPRLLASINNVSAPAVVASGTDYELHFTASIADLHYKLNSLTLFRRGMELVFVSNLDSLPDPNLPSQSNDTEYCAKFSTQPLLPATYTLKFVANGPAAIWSVTVK